MFYSREIVIFNREERFLHTSFSIPLEKQVLQQILILKELPPP